MNIHQDILPRLVEICLSIDNRCGLVLIGSVARGAERADSDVDLNLIFPGDDCPTGRHPYVADDNRWQLQRKDVVQGLRIDVAWETERVLLARVRSDDVINCWPFSNGRVLHDPGEIAAPALEIAKRWFASRPDVTGRYEAESTARKGTQPRGGGSVQT